LKLSRRCISIRRGIAGRSFTRACVLGVLVMRFDRATLFLAGREQIVGLIRPLDRRLFVSRGRCLAVIGLGVRDIGISGWGIGVCFRRGGRIRGFSVIRLGVRGLSFFGRRGL